MTSVARAQALATPFPTPTVVLSVVSTQTSRPCTQLLTTRQSVSMFAPLASRLEKFPASDSKLNLQSPQLLAGGIFSLLARKPELVEHNHRLPYRGRQWMRDCRSAGTTLCPRLSQTKTSRCCPQILQDRLRFQFSIHIVGAPLRHFWCNFCF